MLGKWKKTVNDRQTFGALLMDLCKVFDLLNLNLLIQKLHSGISLEEISKLLIEWFKDKEMKLNTDKCYLILNDTDIKMINVDDSDIKMINFTIKSTKS